MNVTMTFESRPGTNDLGEPVQLVFCSWTDRYRRKRGEVHHFAGESEASAWIAKARAVQRRNEESRKYRESEDSRWREERRHERRDEYRRVRYDQQYA